MTTRESLSLSEGQRALQDNVRTFLGDQLSSAELRGSLDSATGYDPELHARLAGELGLCGLTIPTEFGGLGMTQVEASVVHAELGRALYPGPFLPSCLAAGALLAARDGEACARWLPLLADGSVTGTVATADEAGHWSPGPESVRAKRKAGGWQLSGRRWFVIAAHVAGIVVIPAITESGLALFLVESGSRGFAVSRQVSFDPTRRISITSLDATPAVLLSQDAAAALGQAEHEFLLATAAEAAGGIGWCLDASIAYVKDRERFGSPAGSFQAIARSCMDMLEDLQSVSSAARYAAAATADGAPEAEMAARVAALRAGEAYRDVTEAAIRLFGGIGFTWEQDTHLHYRRAWSAERMAGGPEAHRAAIQDLASRLSRQLISRVCPSSISSRCGRTARSRYASCVPVAMAAAITQGA